MKKRRKPMNSHKYSLYQEYSTLHDSKPEQTKGPQNLDITTNGICKKFIHGKCRLIDNCPYSHNRKHIKPCVTFLSTGECRFGDTCNFMHDLKVCLNFLSGNCEKGEFCQLRHIFKSCPDFDSGFCLNGPDCKLKHIVRKLCWDYALGFCQKGNLCPDFHPKAFIEEDFEGSKELFKKLNRKEAKYYACNYCGEIGHKANKCAKKIELEGNQMNKCGICGLNHPLLQDCNEKLGL